MAGGREEQHLGSEAGGPEVRVEADGPYVVTGGLRLRHKRIAVSDDGQSLTWQNGELITPGDSYRLCRCGRTATPPFCDDTHEAVDFDGTETAPTDDYAERCSTYPGAGITVRDDRSICAGAGFCSTRLTDVWRMVDETADSSVRSRLMAMIERCPSGALSYAIGDDVNEPDYPVQIAVVEAGPLWLTGGVGVTRGDGARLEVRHRVALCRCGRSGNKPLCDGSHAQDSEQATEEAVEPRSAIRTPFGLMVVASDGSLDSEALAICGAIATLTHTDAKVVHVAPEGAERDRVVESLERWSIETGLREGTVEVVARAGHAAEAVIEEAGAADAGVIVIGRGGTRPSHTVHRLSNRAPCDVLVVATGGHDLDYPYRRITIATDGSSTADRAARRGYHVARAFAASVDLVFVGHPATGELITADTIAAYGGEVDTTVHLLDGDPARRILEATRETDADLVVIGNKGMTGLRGVLTESVPKRVLDGAAVDVLVCRTVRQIASQLAPGEGGVIERHGELLAAYVDPSGELHTMSARCTHLGCTVGWNAATSTFDCPCHGSRFAPDGSVVNGPAGHPLPPA